MVPLWLVLLAGCGEEPPVAPAVAPPAAEVAAAPEEAAAAKPAPVVLDQPLSLGADERHTAALAGSPALAAAYTEVIAALEESTPLAERISVVASVRSRALGEVPAEDGASQALRERFELALHDALAASFLAYTRIIVDGAGSAEEKRGGLQALESTLMLSPWNWDAPARNEVQTQLMMALRTL